MWCALPAVAGQQRAGITVASAGIAAAAAAAAAAEHCAVVALDGFQCFVGLVKLLPLNQLGSPGAQQQHLQPQLQSYMQGLPQLFLKFLSQQSKQQQSFLHQNPPKHFQKTLSGWHQLQAVAKIMPRTKP